MSAPATITEALERFEPVIGLEVHAQLSTRSKIFSGASTRFVPDQPNTNITEYCIGLPGVLPVLNRSVVAMAIRAGLALDCEIRQTSVFSRKHYFYPDLPKGYQISQYDLPICEHGHLDVIVGDDQRRVGITRIHMEEDAGKNTHVDGAPITLVDLNRAGIPLIEIVSEPDIRSAAEAAAYLRALRSILMTIGVCDGNMEEGSFRCDANVSIRPRGTEPFGTRCEVKNLNSFRFVEQAIEVEILRHARIVAEGGAIEQQTRLFDSAKKQTRAMRSKEEAHDYRYFPDPDLPPLVVTAEQIDAARAELPELPAAKIDRYKALGVPTDHARSFAEERDVAAFFDDAIQVAPEHAVPIAHFMKTEVLRELKDEIEGIRDAKLAPAALAELVRLKEADRISSTQQKKLFIRMWKDGAALDALMKDEGEQVGDADVLGPIVDEILAAHPDEVEQLKAGKMKLLSFFIGQAMKATKGKAKPPLLKELIMKKIEET